MLSIAVNLFPGVTAIADSLVDALPGDISKHVPKEIDAFLEADTTFFYQAFPQENNEVEFSAAGLNFFLMLDDADSIPFVRGGLPPLTLPIIPGDILDGISLEVSFVLGASFDLGAIIPVELPDVPAIALNPQAITQFFPFLADAVKGIGDVLDVTIFPGLPPKDIKALGATIIDKGEILKQVKVRDILPDTFVDVLDGLAALLSEDIASGGVFLSLLDGDDSADLSSVTGVSQVVFGGVGNDTIRPGGGMSPLEVLGFSTSDTQPIINLFGNSGIDTFVVNPAFNTDNFNVDGGANNDILRVEGTDSTDIFRIISDPKSGVPLRIQFEQPNPSGGATANEVQRITLPTGVSGGTFTLTTQNGETSAIDFDAPPNGAGSVQEALEQELGVGNVSVSGVAGESYTVTFGGSLANQDLPLLFGDGANLVVTGGNANVLVSQAANPNAGVNEVQTVELDALADGGSFTLTFTPASGPSQTTVAIDQDATPSVVEDALEALTSIGAGNVSVSGVSGGPWLVEFTGDLGGANQNPLSGNGLSLTGGVTANVNEGTKGLAGVNEIQRISLPADITGGDFTLSFTSPLAITDTTQPIPYNATAAEVQSALRSLASIGPDGVMVTGGVGGPWDVEFSGTALKGLNVNDLVVDGLALTGGIDVNVTQTLPPFVLETTIAFDGTPIGGTFTLSFDNGSINRTTTPLGHDALASEVEAALEALASTPSSLPVSGTAGGPWTLAGLLADELSGDGSGLLAGPSITPTTIQSASAFVDEVQTVTFDTTPSGGSIVGGTFTLGLGVKETEAIPAGASSLQIRQALEDALGAGNVAVSGSVNAGLTVTFVGDLSGTDVADLVVDASDLTQGLSVTTQDDFIESGGVNEIQTVGLPLQVSGGTFQVTFDPDPTDAVAGETTDNAIDFDVDGAGLQSALEADLSNIDPGDIAVVGPAGGPWMIEFTGQYDETDVGLLSIDGSNLVLNGGFINTDELTKGNAGGDTIVLSTTDVASITSVEQLQIDGAGGDDKLIIQGALDEFSEGVFFDGGDGTDVIELISNDPTPEFVAPIFPDDVQATLTFDSQRVQFTDVEGGLTFDAHGQAGAVTVTGTDGGNEIRFAGDPNTPGLATFANDGQVTITLQNFAVGSAVNVDGAQGDDDISLAPNRLDEFSRFSVHGGGPTGADSLRLEGTSSGDILAYSPNPASGGADTESGKVVYDLGGNRFVDVDFSGISDVSLLGLGGDDSLQVCQSLSVSGTLDCSTSLANSNDTILLYPQVEGGGSFEYIADTNTSRFRFAPVAFQSFENQDFNTGGGSDTLSVSSDDLPGVNSSASVIGGAGATTVDFGVGSTTFTHDTALSDTITLEIGTHTDEITVTPGTAIDIAVNSSFGDDTLIFNAQAADLNVDLSGRRLSQTGFGDVTHTGISQINLIAAGADPLTVVSGDAAPVDYRPTGADSGEFSSAAVPTEYAFDGFTGDFSIDFHSSHDDEVIVQGTAASDVITASAATRTVTVKDTTGTFLKAVILGSQVDILTIEALAGHDTILVSPDPEGDPDLQLHVNGDIPNASDRLVVEDQGVGNTIQHHQGPDERSGSVIVGTLPAVSYEGIEFVDIVPLDSDPTSATFGGTGSDGLGRIVVFHPDTFSHNNSLRNPTELDDLAEHTAKPNINPGGQTDPFGLGFDLSGDEDWYRFAAPKTGTFQFEVVFDPVGTLANGQPGLPGDGLLGIDLFQSDGTSIDRLATETDPAVQTIGVEEGRSYLLRVAGQTAESINVYDVRAVDVDTLGPQVFDPDGAGPEQAVQITGEPEFNLFDVKPTEGPTPLVTGLTINIQDLPVRFPGFVYGALDTTISSQEGHFRLVGDHSGIIAIDQIVVTNAPVMAGELATATIELRFDAPLPDDRFTLTLSDSIVDPSGNGLDGESNASQPQGTPSFPSGDTVAGGDFVARFTVDSRPEVATYLGDGTFYIDLNGNGIFDPDTNDFTNRDIVWKFGTKDDLPVIGDWDGDGFDQIGVLGKRGGTDMVFLDLDGNGAFDPVVDAAFEYNFQGSENGIPIAGDWDGDGSDEIATFHGSSWFVDDTGTPYTPALAEIDPTRINTSMKGLPVAGDWDGDGSDNVGTFNQDQFFLDTDGDFRNSELTVQFPEFDFGGLHPQPVAHDWDQDGDDDIGLFVVRETGANSGAREAGEWFLDVNTDLSGSGTVEATFEPPLTGQPGVAFVNQDRFLNFGDEREPAALGGLIPVVGNFDPPVSASTFRFIAAGDANGDFHFDQQDVVQVLQAAKYLTGKPATFQEGDWNGDSIFDGLDIVAALQTGNYLRGAYAEDAADAMFAEFGR